MKTGILYIVATPIGNLEDITFRAVRTLKEVDLIAAEDTRHSRKLLSHYGINTPLTSFHEHNEQLKTGTLLEQLQEGKSLALITDAGTPCIADPGYRIARAAVAAGIRVVPLPGPSAIITALSAAGLPTDRFAFEGFLPPKQGKKRSKLELLAHEKRLLILYEAPHRLTQTLFDMADILGERQAVVARELTKIHEEFRQGTLIELARHYEQQPPRGEIVILVAPDDEPHQESAPDLAELLRRHILEEGRSVKDSVALVAAKTAVSRSEIYELALIIRNNKPFDN